METIQQVLKRVAEPIIAEKISEILADDSKDYDEKYRLIDAVLSVLVAMPITEPPHTWLMT